MGSQAQVAKELGQIKGVALKLRAAGAELTTFHIGGPIECLLEPESEEGLAGLAQVLRSAGFGARLLGAGSNLLISSRGVPGYVIKLGRGFGAVRKVGAAEFEVGGGVRLMNLSRQLCEAGYAGLEFAAGIPGSVGGAACMNAGAHGRQIMDVIGTIRFLDRDGQWQIRRARDLPVAYRQGGLPAGAIVSSIALALSQEDPRLVQARRAELLAERRRKQPLEQPSAGSVFKNPAPDKSAGWLIEQAGLKGRCKGGACISEKHANWIVNPERRATHQDVLELMRLCHRLVLERFSIELVPEIQMWCEEAWEKKGV